MERGLGTCDTLLLAFQPLERSPRLVEFCDGNLSKLTQHLQGRIFFLALSTSTVSLHFLACGPVTPSSRPAIVGQVHLTVHHSDPDPVSLFHF